MKNILKIITAITILTLLPLKSISAESLKLRYISSTYSDNKGAGLKFPEGVACNEKNIVIVADTGNYRLVQYTLQDGTLKGGDEIKVSELSYPVNVQLNSKGEIFALDGKQRRIVRLGAEGAFKGYIDPQGLLSPSNFVPRSFKIDNADNMYVLDIAAGRVFVLDPEGKFLRQVEFPDDYGFFSDLAVDSKGNIYLVDSISAVVYSAPKNSKSFSVFAKDIKEYMNFPVNMTVDNKGVIYLADKNGSGIALIGQDGSFHSRQLSFGWKESLVRYPSQLCINESGELFVADRNNSRIQIFKMVK